MNAIIDALNAHPDIDKAGVSKHYRLDMEPDMTAIRARVRRWEWPEDCIVILEIDDALLDEHKMIRKMILREAYRAAQARGYLS